MPIIEIKFEPGDSIVQRGNKVREVANEKLKACHLMGIKVLKAGQPERDYTGQFSLLEADALKIIYNED